MSRPLKFASTRINELEELVNLPSDQTEMETGSYDRIVAMSIISIPLNETERTYISRSDRIATAVEGYERNLNLAITKAEKVRDGETSLGKVALAIINHLDRLDDIEDEAYEAARGPVMNSKDVAINGNIKALQNLAKVNPVKATEMNLQAIQGRLERAESEASRGDDKGVEDALQEYEKLRDFGEEISQIAQGLGKDEARVEELIAEATSVHLEVLAKVYEKVPEQAKPVIERAMQESIKGYEKAREALEKAGPGAANIPERPELPSVVPEEIRDRLKPSPPSEKVGASDNVTEQSALPFQVPEGGRDGFIPSPPVDIPDHVPDKVPGRK